jgi:hypothetical protein
VDDATAAVRDAVHGVVPNGPVRLSTGSSRAGPSRRQVLRLTVLVPALLVSSGACGTGLLGPAPPPDPLVALADAARADAALAAGAAAADPALAPQIGPLRDARLEHVDALDAEVVRAGGAVPAAVTPTPSAARAPAATLVALRDAVGASHRAAAQLVVDLPAHRVGLVASVAACCATYASVLA